MPKITTKLPSAESVAPGSTATFRLPIGATYEQILISYSGGPTTGFYLLHMKEIRLVGNGKTIMRFPTVGNRSGGQLLDKLNQFEGRGSANGVIVLDLNRFGIRTRSNEELTGLGTGYKPTDAGYKEMGGLGVEISTLYLEIDIADTAQAPVLSAKAVQSPKRPLGLIKKVRHFTYTAAAVGENEVSDLPRGDLINKIIVHSDDVNNMKIETDRNVRFDRTTKENELIQYDGGRVPQSLMWVYDPSEIGNGSEALPTRNVQDLRLTLDMAAAGPIPMTVEYIGTLEL